MGLVTQTIAFAAGIIPTASDWSNQFDTIYNLVNGQLDSANVDKTSADGIMVLDTAQTRTATLTQSADLFVSNTYGLTIGNGSQIAVYGVTPELQQHGTASADATYALTRFSADAVGPSVVVGKSRAAAIGTFTVVQDNDVLGEFIFAGADGTDMATPGARIHAEVDGTPGGNDLPTALVFSVTADGAATVTEAFRISTARVHTFSGQVVVGADDTGYDVTLYGATAGKRALWDESEDTLQLMDNTNLTFGTGADADVYYDGTDLIINPAVVGTGDVVLTGGSLEFDDSEGVTLGTGKDATLRYDGTHVVMNTRAVGSGNFNPGADDGGALGTSGTGWSDLFLASGAVVNFNAGDVTLTHSANALAFAGGNYTFTGDLALDGDLDFTGPQEISTTSGALTLNPTTDVLVANGKGVVVGHTAQVTTSGANEFQVLGNGTDDSRVTIGTWSSDNVGPGIQLLKSRNTTIGSSTIVQDGDILGFVAAYADDGTDFVSNAADIIFKVDGTPGANDTPGRIEFRTAPDGTQAVTEKMRVTSGGLVIIGDGTTATSQNMTIGLRIDQRGNDDNALELSSSDISGNSGGTTWGFDGTDDDVYFAVRKSNATAGQTFLAGYTEDGVAAGTPALDIHGFGGTPSTAAATTAVGIINYTGREHDGAGAITNTTTNHIVHSFRGHISGALRTLVTIDIDGDVAVDGTDLGAGTFDTEPDYLMARAIRAVANPDLWPGTVELLRKYTDTLEAGGILVPNRVEDGGDGVPFLKLKKGLAFSLDMGYQTGKAVFEQLLPALKALLDGDTEKARKLLPEVI